MLALAVGLWLSGGDPTRAASASTTQSVSATVTSSISWGTVGACTQSAGAAAFGSLAPGGSSTAPAVGAYLGCISSNATWSVSGTMTTMPSSGSESIAASNFRAEVVAVPLGAGTAACPSGNSNSGCTLDNPAVNLVSNAPATPIPLLATALTNGFTYDYKLNVPSNQPAGAYTGGVVTLTASN
jgi:hypothetical protein